MLAPSNLPAVKLPQEITLKTARLFEIAIQGVPSSSVWVLNENRSETFKQCVNSNLASQRAAASSVAEKKNCSNYTPASL